MSSLLLLCLVSVLLRPLLDLDTCSGTDPLGVFSLFLKKVADIIAQKYAYFFVGSSVLDRFRSVAVC